MYIRGSTFKLFSSSLLLNSDISCPTWLQQQTDGEWECTLEEYLKEKWYACLGRERGYCSSRKWHTQASIDSLVAIRPILICKKPPSLSSCGQFMATSPPHTSFVRNAIIIAPLSLSPMWHPYLKSIFSQRKHCPIPLQPTSPLTWEENLTQVVRGIINLSNLNKCVCFALYFHIVVFILNIINHFPFFDRNKGNYNLPHLCIQGGRIMRKHFKRGLQLVVCAHIPSSPYILLHATANRFQV